MESAIPTMFTAGEFMTTEVVTVRATASIEEAADLLELHRISGLPVVDSESRLLGIITEYDVLRGIAEFEMRGTVAAFMSPASITTTEDATIVDVARTFLTEPVRRIPVTRDGRLVGVISRRDIVFAGSVRQYLLDAVRSHD